MPTMTTPQEIAAAIDMALEAGGHLVIRFGHGQMRQLKLEEVELLVATLKTPMRECTVCRRMIADDLHSAAQSDAKKEE